MLYYCKMPLIVAKKLTREISQRERGGGGGGGVKEAKYPKVLKNYLLRFNGSG